MSRFIALTLAALALPAQAAETYPNAQWPLENPHGSIPLAPKVAQKSSCEALRFIAGAGAAAQASANGEQLEAGLVVGLTPTLSLEALGSFGRSALDAGQGPGQISGTANAETAAGQLTLRYKPERWTHTHLRAGVRFASSNVTTDTAAVDGSNLVLTHTEERVNSTGLVLGIDKDVGSANVRFDVTVEKDPTVLFSYRIGF